MRLLRGLFIPIRSRSRAVKTVPRFYSENLGYLVFGRFAEVIHRCGARGWPGDGGLEKVAHGWILYRSHLGAKLDSLDSRYGPHLNSTSDHSHHTP